MNKYVLSLDQEREVERERRRKQRKRKSIEHSDNKTSDASFAKRDKTWNRYE